jgi:hypothetical protein
MNFIEQVFGVSPDGGTGSMEVLLFLVPLVAAAAFVRWRKHRSISPGRDLVGI